eukprot:tig00000681_g3074.t1
MNRVRSILNNPETMEEGLRHALEMHRETRGPPRKRTAAPSPKFPAARQGGKKSGAASSSSAPQQQQQAPGAASSSQRVVLQIRPSLRRCDIRTRDRAEEAPHGDARKQRAVSAFNRMKTGARCTAEVADTTCSPTGKRGKATGGGAPAPGPSASGAVSVMISSVYVPGKIVLTIFPKLVGEFAGTFVFLLAIMNMTSGKSSQQGGINNLLIALALLGAILAFNGICDAHFNPAVTIMKMAEQLASGRAGGVAVGAGLGMILAQALGALSALGIRSTGDGTFAAYYCRDAEEEQPVVSEEPFFAAVMGIAGGDEAAGLASSIFSDNDEVQASLAALCMLGRPFRRWLALMYPRKLAGSDAEEAIAARNTRAAAILKAPEILAALVDPMVLEAAGAVQDPAWVRHLALKVGLNGWRFAVKPPCLPDETPCDDWPVETRCFFKLSFFNHSCGPSIGNRGSLDPIVKAHEGVANGDRLAGEEATLSVAPAMMIRTMLGEPCRCHVCADAGARKEHVFLDMMIFTEVGQQMGVLAEDEIVSAANLRKVMALMNQMDSAAILQAAGALLPPRSCR